MAGPHVSVFTDGSPTVLRAPASQMFWRTPTIPRCARSVARLDAAAISRPRAAQIAALWGARCESHAFPAAWNAPHDCVDPAQPGAQIALVYPQLQAWIDAADLAR